MNGKIRSISTANLETLEQFQPGKNRQYTQLQAGKVSGHYAEVVLGQVHLFRENIVTGTRIEAAPAATFLPFGAVIESSDDFRFCGKKRKEGSLFLASGGNWDLCFKDHLDYIGTVFDRNTFSQNVEDLTGQPVPQEWLATRLAVTNQDALTRYSQGVSSIQRLMQSRPSIANNSNAIRVLDACVLALTLDALKPLCRLNEPLQPQARRFRGVHRVIDYLRAHAAVVPTMAELCNIAAISERSLEYGFREYLNLTPVTYLRLVRLNGARRDLLASANPKARVSDIALRWGFVEFGRFARNYKQLFEELPSHTMRK